MNGIFNTEALARLIKNSSWLLDLSLHYNHITQTSGLALIKALQKNQTLKVLDLSFNKLGGGGDLTRTLARLR
jgi:Ran GTPase-activating protein (RanGAP) involved in mRNA processing and transport